MFKRDISETLQRAASQFPIVVVTGPRQSGKTTLLQNLFTEYEYVNLENPSTRSRVMDDPNGFFHDRGTKSWIIDEAQRYPDLFSYLQQWSDELKTPGKFILSGSQNFLLLQNISQTLAGRAAILELLPLTYHELCSDPEFTQLKDLYKFLYNGTYPRVYHEKIDIDLWYNSYISTYLERDVRNTINIKDIAKFQLFLKLCAGRHGQLLNLNSLAQECGISQPTAQHWISILEASYILFKLQPYHNNFNKRVVKTPKLYFYDSAIVCQLLGINSIEQLKIHSNLGAIFEGFVISEFKKVFFNKGKRSPLYFWRTQSGDEIDVLIEQGDMISTIEIKSTKTFTTNLLKTLYKATKLMDDKLSDKALIYGGDEYFITNGINVFSWQNINYFFKLLESKN